MFASPHLVIETIMGKKGVALIAIGFIIVALTWAVFLNLYYLRDDTGGQMLWNSNEAYFFMGVACRGFRFRLVDYPSKALSEWLNAPALPSGGRNYFTVIRVTASGIERHEVKVQGNVPDLFTPIGETIYANCQGTLCKWTGENFESATLKEQQKLHGINDLASDIDGTINGWSKRGIGAVAGDSQLSIEIGKGISLKVRQGNIYRSGDSATVELYRSGQTPQILWHVNEQPRRVSKREYERALSVEGDN